MTVDKYICPDCDPECFVVYGFCRTCLRKCNTPLFDINGSRSILDCLEIVKNWDAEQFAPFPSVCLGMGNCADSCVACDNRRKADVEEMQ